MRDAWWGSRLQSDTDGPGPVAVPVTMGQTKSEGFERDINPVTGVL